MKTFVVVRDEQENRTVLCREVSGSKAEALHEALTYYPDSNCYSVDLLFGRDWPSALVGYPKYADASPGM